MVPRIGPGSDLLTQSAVIRNLTAQNVTFQTSFQHRAVHHSFVEGRSFSVGHSGVLAMTLGNVLPPRLTLSELRATLRLTCP